jgi:WD40 repeat protein
MIRKGCSLLLSLTLLILLGAALPVAQAADTQGSVRTIPVNSKGFGFRLSPDGKTAAIFDNAILLSDQPDPLHLPIRLIDLDSGVLKGVLAGATDYANDAAFTPDSQRLISFHNNGDINVWDVSQQKAIETVSTGLMGYARAWLTTDGKTLVTFAGGLPAHLLFWDTSSWSVAKILGPTFSTYLDFKNNFTKLPAQGDIEFSAVTVSPDGKTAATATFNDEVQVWDVGTGKPTTLLAVTDSDKKMQLSIRSMSFSLDGKTLVYTQRSTDESKPGTFIHVWDLDRSVETATIKGGDAGLALSPDGKSIAWLNKQSEQQSTLYMAALASPDQATKIADLPLGQPVVPTVSAVTFLPDGSGLLAGGFFASDDNNSLFVVSLKAS